jgi:hypothetical protein
MPEITVSTGKAAIIEVIDEALRQQIYDHLNMLEDKSTTVEFRPAERKIVLVFSDSGQVELGVDDHMDALNDVQSSGGRYLVYASNPEPAPTARTLSMSSGGTPINPPPPDTMCPCGGP